MAGGVGSRFWPLSKISKPKQFLDILGTGRTLLQMTFDRFNKICPSENILIVTNSIYKDIVNEQLPEIIDNNILLEPVRRNTAPCIAYANNKILQLNKNANIITAPSDHLILKEDNFLKVVANGLKFVEDSNVLLTLGIKPSRPETGYGYIQIDNKKPSNSNKNIRQVKTFTEKPDKDIAQVFFESGEFFWNSGIFIWSLNSIQKAFNNYLPEVNSLFEMGKDLYNTNNETDFISDTYQNCPNISIDYGVMEKAENVFVYCSDFGWADLGTWGALHEQLETDSNNNAIIGENIFSYNINNCIINTPKDKLTVLQGLDDYIIVDSNDILLICKKENEQEIKKFVHDIKLKKGNKYL